MKLRKRGYRHPYWLWWSPDVAPQWVRDRYAAYDRYRTQFFNPANGNGYANLMKWQASSDAAVGYIVGRE